MTSPLILGITVTARYEQMKLESESKAASSAMEKSKQNLVKACCAVATPEQLVATAAVTVGKREKGLIAKTDAYEAKSQAHAAIEQGRSRKRWTSALRP